ncbi:RNA 2',3'-cyclic phosphodiesterase [Desulfotomaculum nigrificans]|uniref:RNA 2',3'-cyclic phosphodiesterase n=1 Tax=Desulfotomaculum nigrificans TaxID=1565 RepID=UPI0001FAEA69|nr:RNA 2',3'-cyclic phosphodiesterase [Desulfotomaculum nigrificans]
MQNLRLFIAIDVPDSLKNSLTELQRTIFADSSVKLVEQQNLHLTLKFLGETPGDKCPDIVQAMQQTVIGCPPFQLRLHGLGIFPTRGNPKVVWVGIGGARGKLITLQQNLEQNLAGFGFPAEGRKYSPHLTLGRLREPLNLNQLQTNIGRYREQEFGAWQVSAIKLMQSTLTKAGPIYKVLATIPLG